MGKVDCALPCAVYCDAVSIREIFRRTFEQLETDWVGRASAEKWERRRRLIPPWDRGRSTYQKLQKAPLFGSVRDPLYGRFMRALTLRRSDVT